MVHPLSKSKMMAYRQCRRRLWLEVHRADLRQDSQQTETRFSVGHRLGEISRVLYDPKQKGRLIDLGELGVSAALTLSQDLLSERKVLFEAGFSAGGALAFTDIMLPVTRKGKAAWNVIEVKSSTSVKDYHRDDAAVQAYVMRSAGVDYDSISLAHIDTSFIYDPKKGYAGLLSQKNLTKEVDARFDEVKEWVKDAQSVIASPVEPSMRTGRHCYDPYECGFYAHCSRGEPKAAIPVSVLPRVQSKALKALIADNPVLELADVPDDMLNDQQRRVKSCTLSGALYFDQAATARELARHALPAYFMDFETAQMAIPVWKGMRPYQQVPFQFSVHRLSQDTVLSHDSFLDLSGGDPSKAFAVKLIEVLGKTGTIFVYNAAFEKGRIRELAEKFPKLREALLALNDRVVDLLPIARQHYYHPSQEGSWSIKSVLPAIAPDLRYDALEGVQHGGDAMAAYEEAILPETIEQRRQEIEQQLHEYCKLDTYAMVRMWQVFTGDNQIKTL